MNKKHFNFDHNLQAVSDIKIESVATLKKDISINDYGGKIYANVKGVESNRTASWLITIPNYLLDQNKQLETLETNDVIWVKGKLNYKSFEGVNQENTQQQTINITELFVKEITIEKRFKELFPQRNETKQNEYVKIRSNPFQTIEEEKTKQEYEHVDEDGWEKLEEE